MTWSQVINDPLLQNLPFKIELNKFGQILMSPASNRHGMIQGELSYQIRRKKKSGKIITECSIDTSDGVKVADVAWASDEFLGRNGEETPFREAPELCVEIVSPSNSHEEIGTKKDLYLAKGAVEVWVVDEKGSIRIFNHRSETRKSELVKIEKIDVPETKG